VSDSIEKKREQTKNFQDGGEGESRTWEAGSTNQIRSKLGARGAGWMGSFEGIVDCIIPSASFGERV